VDLHTFDYVLWLTCPCLQSGLLIVMHRRRKVSEFPFFYTYTIWQVVSVIFLVCVERFSYSVYYYSYWAVSLVSVATAFALIDELFRLAFRRFAALRDLGRIVFRWAVIMVLFVALVNAMDSRHAPVFDRVSALVLIADRSARTMLCGLVILLLLGGRYLLISPRSLLFGISLGVAMFTSVKVIVVSLMLQQLHRTHLLNRINTLAYILSCLVWLAYFALAEEPGPAAEKPPAVAPRLAGAESPLDEPSSARLTTLLESLNTLVEDSLRDGNKRS
jgi:hypothetical protein